MRIGYARVSTEEQKLDLQISALNAAECEALFVDQGISGKEFDRPGLAEALRQLSKGDTLVVWRLDRLGRSLIDLVKLVDELGEKGIHFCSLRENIDTTSSGGRLVFHMMAALAEFERNLISERTRAGMAAARESGQRFGRPPSLSDDELTEADYAIREKHEQMSDVALRYRVTTRSLRRLLKKRLDQQTNAQPSKNCRSNFR
jgi:DNA invertase Pin-like site-specific DNA recombinase